MRRSLSTSSRSRTSFSRFAIAILLSFPKYVNNSKGWQGVFALFSDMFPCILVDPPWPMELTGRFKRRPFLETMMPYSTMSIEEITNLPVQTVANENCHLWLWTVNCFLGAGFDIMRAWGFKYMCPFHWIKPSGFVEKGDR